MSDVIVSAQGIEKSYKSGTSDLKILRGVDFSLNRGDAVCIVGASGAGKSTLLHILGTLDKADAGELRFEGRSINLMSEQELAALRNQSLGFVFQFHHLMSEFTALENVMLPCRLHGDSKAQAQEKAEVILEQLGLKDRRHHYSFQLSGGEMQRVAIARALVQKPKLLLADEPTGNLDSTNAAAVQDLFFYLKEALGLSLIVVTHDMNFAKKFARVLRMTDGQFF